MKLLFALFFWLSSAALAATDLNSASQRNLEELPGIGPGKARAIIQYRQDNGPFRRVDDLDDVPGIGRATIANLRGQVTVGGSTGGGGAATSATAPSTRADEQPTIDINSANLTQLRQLPGLDASKARAILAYRRDNGPFPSCQALSRVEGIGPATIAALRDRCTAD